MDLPGKIAVVTGGTKGIGRAVAEALTARGVRVAVCSRAGQSPFGHDNIDVFKCDVRRHDQVRSFIDAVAAKWGRIDILVNNAGVLHMAEFEDLTIEQWIETVETNLHGAVYATKAALAMLKQSRGHIVNICSRSSRNPNPKGTFYNASKFGLLGFSDALAIDMMKWGIRVSSILPGQVATELGNVPAAQWQLTAQDVAEAVVYALGNPSRIHNSTIELRPARPA